MKILVVKLADIGDVLTATPALRSLRESLPEARIDVLVPPHSKAVLDGSPVINNTLLFRKGLFDRVNGVLSPGSLVEALSFVLRLRSIGYDSVAIMHHLTTTWGSYKYAALALASGAKVRAGLDNGRGWFLTHKAKDDGFGALHEVEYCLEVAKLLGAEGRPGPLEIPVGPDHLAYARAVLPDKRPIVAIHPGSGAYSTARRWPLESFAALAELLSRGGAYVLVVGGPGEEGLADHVVRDVPGPHLNMAGKTNVRQLAALLGRCDAFIGSDSGVMHIATAVATPVVAIFGPSNHKAWGPWTPDGGNDKSLENTAIPANRIGLPVLPAGAGLETCPERRHEALEGQGRRGTPLVPAILPGKDEERSQPPFLYPQDTGAARRGGSMVVRRDIPCSPCFYVGLWLGSPEGCPSRTCLQEISPETVAEATWKMMDVKEKRDVNSWSPSR